MNIINKLFRRNNQAPQYYYGMKVDDRPDPQQFAVYNWQHKLMTVNEMYAPVDFYHAVDKIKHMLRKYQIDMPTVSRGLLPMPAYDEHDHGLYFPQYVTMHGIYHEVAHVIQVAAYGKDVEGHGPEYVRAYIDLLTEHRFGGTCRHLLRASAIRHGLKLK